MKIQIEPDERILFLNAVYKFGAKSEILMAIEEMSELTKELCKQTNRGCNNKEQIAEEIADVLITLGQILTMYDINQQVTLHIKDKIDRLEELIYV